jgi:hypothetical protein
MASALSLTMCSISFGSPVGIAKMASMSLISARPMIVWLSLWVTVMS